MATLEEIRQKLLAQQAKTENNNNSNTGGDRASFPFWNIDNDATAVLRFLPDADPTNTFFWVERLIIKLPFNGVKGEVDTREITVQVPCMEMYGKSCPILTEIRPWWNDKELEDTARKYWKKRSYLFQGFVTQNPLKEDNVPENPIRRFIINPSIFKTIKASLMDPEMEDLPTDYDAGVDFRLTKTKKGDFADYSTSNWARKSRSLSEEEREAISKFGLFNLKDFLPKEPTDEEVEIIKQMFQDSVDGKAYDPAKYGNHFKPYGLQTNNDSSSTSTSNKVDDEEEATSSVDALEKLKSRVASKTETETPTTSNDGEKQDASKILEILRNRNKA